MAPETQIAAVLGGPRIMGKVTSAEGLREAVRAGLPVSAMTALQKTLDISSESLSHLISLPERTLARRRKQRKLTADESDRVVRVARITARAIDLLGSLEKANHWLRAPNRALGGTAPLSLLDTEVGAQQVDEVLGRIEYGIYS
jgi:putative toxin-antitoxin system antitoxin component (TIGR02293 family)